MKTFLLVSTLLSLVPLVAALLFGGGRGLATGRARRLLRLGRLSARLSTSFVGASVRRLFAGRAGRARIDEARRAADARLVAETMGHMKGALMKLGQMLSFVSDDIPVEYRDALASLQASAPAMDIALLRDVAERELGRPLERAFAHFDAAPLASASIGQVHRAALPSGEEVAVKIQYPGVADAIRADLANVGVLYAMMGMVYPALEPGPVVDELRARVSEELDYVREASNQRAFRDLYEDHPFIRVPRVVDSHSTRLVLTSELVDGRRYADILAAPQAERDRYGEILYRFVFSSIVRFGVFNGDPHPGNYIFDGAGRMVFLDFGCVKYFPDAMLHDWRDLVRSHLAGDRDDFRARLVALRFIPEASPLDTDLLYDYFQYFYEPIERDEPYAFTREYNGRALRQVFAPEGRFAGLTRKLNMPPDFVFVNRIQWGVYSILAQLGATANWHRIHRELLHGEPPSTPLGELDAAYRARWAAARGLDGAELALRPEGIVRRPPPATPPANASTPERAPPIT